MPDIEAMMNGGGEKGLVLWGKEPKATSLDGLLVGLGLGLVGVLVDLVGSSAQGTRDTAGDGVVGGVALGLLLVGLLGSLGGVALDGLGDVVGGVGNGVGDLANDTLVRLVDVRGRHFESVVVGWLGLVKSGRLVCL